MKPKTLEIFFTVDDIKSIHSGKSVQWTQSVSINGVLHDIDLHFMLGIEGGDNDKCVFEI